jgi:hypothetical protein
MNFRNCIIRDSNSDVLTQSVNKQLRSIVSEIDPTHNAISRSVGPNVMRHVSYEDALAELLSLQHQNKPQSESSTNSHEAFC